MQTSNSAPARNGQMNPAIPVPAGKTGPVGGCGSDNPVKPNNGKGSVAGFTGGSVKPGKI